MAVGSPRNALLDLLLPKHPVLRKAVWALPDALKPKAADIIEIQAYDEAGKLVHDLRPSTRTSTCRPASANATGRCG